MHLADMKYFFTQKLSWNNINKVCKRTSSHVDTISSYNYYSFLLRHSGGSAWMAQKHWPIWLLLKHTMLNVHLKNWSERKLSLIHNCIFSILILGNITVWEIIVTKSIPIQVSWFMVMVTVVEVLWQAWLNVCGGWRMWYVWITFICIATTCLFLIQRRTACLK